MEWHHNGYSISDNPQNLQINIIHKYLKDAYWSEGISMETVRRAIKHSLCFGVYHGTKQIGFARVVSDMTKLAYLADVFILPAHQKQGLGKWLIGCILEHPELKTVNRFLLATADAHGLYRHFGFDDLREPQKMMELRRE